MYIAATLSCDTSLFYLFVFCPKIVVRFSKVFLFGHYKNYILIHLRAEDLDLD